MPGFAGPNCERRRCPDDCSGHGRRANPNPNPSPNPSPNPNPNPNPNAGWRAAAGARRLQRALAATLGLRGGMAGLRSAWARLVGGVVWRMRGRRGRARGATHRHHALRRASMATWTAWVKVTRNN